MTNVRPPSGRRRPPYFRTKKVAFVGMTPSYAYTPFEDPAWTVGVHPCCHTVLPHGYEPDFWFDLHPPSCFTTQKGWHRDYYGWLKKLRQPIFMQKDWPEIPNAIRFPKERILAEFRKYFTNHVAWMIALAMTEGATHIGVFGCEYSSDQERGLQRGSLEYWLGRFEGSGGHVVLPPGSTLLNKPKELYGYESHDLKTGKIIAAYRGPAKKGADLQVPPQLTVMDPKAAPQIPLAKPPVDCPESEPAWERSGLLVHA